MILNRYFKPTNFMSKPYAGFQNRRCALYSMVKDSLYSHVYLHGDRWYLVKDTRMAVSGYKNSSTPWSFVMTYLSRKK